MVLQTFATSKVFNQLAHLHSLNRFYLHTACIGKGTQHKVKAVARLHRFTDWFVSLLFAKTQILFLCGIYGFDLILLIWV